MTKIVSIEGPDGCGKSTLIHNINQILDESTDPHLFSTPTTITETGRLLRYHILKNINVFNFLGRACCSKLFALDMVEAYEKVWSKLDYIIQDRGLLSTVIYQLVADYTIKHLQSTFRINEEGELDKKELKFLDNLPFNSWVIHEGDTIKKFVESVPKPDIVFILDAPDEVLNRRINERVHATDLDKLTILQQIVRATYRHFINDRSYQKFLGFEKTECHVFDTSKLSPEEMAHMLLEKSKLR